MDVNQGYQLMEFITDKVRSGSIGPAKYNLLLETTNLDYFKQEVGVQELYSPQNGLPNIAWQKSTVISDNCRSLITPVDVIINQDGYFPYPNDYGAFSSMMFPLTVNPEACRPAQLKWKPVEEIRDSEWGVRLNSYIKPPILTRPIFRWTKYGYEIAPNNIQGIRLTYLKKPVKPFRAYTGNDVYDPSNSVQWEWPDTCHVDIIIKMCYYVGIKIREAELIDMIQKRMQTGS